MRSLSLILLTALSWSQSIYNQALTYIHDDAEPRVIIDNETQCLDLPLCRQHVPN